MVAPEESRQSVGSRRWCGESPSTTTLSENRFVAEIRPATPLTEAAGW